jgi:2-polyprenyl-3-methyl-5-hydroxy-6-metoxy-1,4-benzoquinol methylase
MKALTTLFMIASRPFSSRPSYFNWLYHISRDPFGNDDSIYERRKLAAILAFTKRRPQQNILDVGCGPGELAAQLAPHGRRVRAIDFSRKAVAIAKARHAALGNVHFESASIVNYCPNIKFDLIVCSEILYYVRRASAACLARAIDNMADLAAPQGWLITSEMAQDADIVRALGARFTLLDRVEDHNWRRPFAVTLFEVAR